MSYNLLKITVMLISDALVEQRGSPLCVPFRDMVYLFASKNSKG